MLIEKGVNVDEKCKKSQDFPIVTCAENELFEAVILLCDKAPHLVDSQCNIRGKSMKSWSQSHSSIFKP